MKKTKPKVIPRPSGLNQYSGVQGKLAKLADFYRPDEKIAVGNLRVLEIRRRGK